MIKGELHNYGEGNDPSRGEEQPPADRDLARELRGLGLGHGDAWSRSGTGPMTEKEIIRTSKFLSLVLRHEPERVGLKLDSAGWVGVAELLEAVNRHGIKLTLDQLKHIVATSDKKRFAFSEDAARIRASQGHSIEVDLQYTPQIPPELLYHGTATRFLDSIRQKGLQKMGRHHVHLSAETVVTVQVGARHGKPALLVIRAGEMHRAGHVFFRSANGVWLVDQVPPQFIEYPTAQPPTTA